jgi:hypothetical protein
MRFSTACTFGLTLSLLVLALAYTLQVSGLSPDGRLRPRAAMPEASAIDTPAIKTRP